ncbi:brain protein I3-like [Paramacrobiotus metropolitanus]|uniref:brain protein I3-like n=1 Tax=Paramacrobiotus metropolitanus TaxID=2943436 RepID=UPI002445D192|nr:brain protein I3-like [Paramacrobiotus metropolitanus]XP_055335403.1 brain protein I3-like [Paramacrobiotus metropolitanus]XP_055335404.1 brain protein I3-like [Paramacrobiotus metropolitanus]XP_055335405.1 brain protein I3-like [Paramacrobiotus metropolitanus]
MGDKYGNSQGTAAYTPLLNHPSLPAGGGNNDYTTGYQSGLPAGYVNSEDEGYGAAGSVPQPEIAIIGGCPACRVGVLDDHYTCSGILCAIFLFPLGILCCLATRQRRCSNCGAVFG